MAERTLTVRLRAVVDGYEKAMGKAAAATEDMANRVDRISSLGKRATETGGDLTRGLTLPIAAAGTAMLITAGNFESSMREIQALTSGSTAEMEMLSTQAMKMGADTQFSAGAAADAMSQLIKGGFDVEQTYAALPAVMQLAASASLDIASAADIATNVLSGMGMEVSELSRVNDVLSQTANASDTDVRELGEAFKMVGPIAKGVGMDLEDTSSILALLAENGIRGTMAGTALRGIIASLVAPSSAAQAVIDRLGLSVTDASGKLLPMADIVQQLNDKGATTSDIYRLFGRETAGAMQALVGTGAPALERMNDLLEKSGGVAQDLADAKMGGLNGAVEQLKGALESLAISSGPVGLFTKLAEGAASLTNSIAGLPGGVRNGIMAIAGIAAATGPAIWAFGKLTTLYAPVTEGLGRMVMAGRNMATTFQLMTNSGLSAGTALTTMFGPQAAIMVGLVALAGLLYYAKKNADSFAASHQNAGDSAVALAESAGVAVTEIGRLEDEASGAVKTIDDFRRANQDAITTLREYDDIEMQEAILLEIGYQFVLRGGSPEQAVDEVTRLAEAAGIAVPVGLTVENVGDFENQVEASAERARNILSNVDTSQSVGGLLPIISANTREMRAELDAVASSATDAFKTDNIAGFVQILAAAEGALGDNEDAVGALADNALKYTEATGLSIWSTTDLASGLAELTSESSSLTEIQKAQLSAIMGVASAMEGGLTPANLEAAAAAQSHVAELAKGMPIFGGAKTALEGVADGADTEGQAMGGAAEETNELADAMTALENEAKLARAWLTGVEAGVDAFSQSIEDSTRLDDMLGANLDTGSALRSLREGLFGTAEGADEAKSSADEAREAIDRLGDAAQGADPALSELGIRMGALASASDAFVQSIADSSMFDNQVESALSLGDAYEKFRKTLRRLPPDLDTTAASMGEYRKGQRTAINNMLDLGKATADYLGTLIESGRSADEVRGEAGRLREEYVGQMRAAGMNEAAIAKMIETMGLAPSTIETALKVSGQDAARFEIQSYLSLLQGKIPATIASTVTAAIEAGDLDGAASQLAQWAKTNPVAVPVEADAGGATDDLWELPKVYDRAAAAAGQYTEAQENGLQALMGFGEKAAAEVAQLAASGDKAGAERLAESYKQMAIDIMRNAGVAEESIQPLLETIGLDDWQIDTAITVSGDARAMATIQLYADLLGGEIPPEVATEVLAQVDEGNLEGAANTLTEWRESSGGDVNIDADTTQAELDLDGLSKWIPLFGGSVPVDADTTAAEDRLAALAGWIPIFAVPGVAKPSSIGLTGPHSANPGAGVPVDEHGIPLAGRASGGPVAAGREYIVGENGPERFKANVGGTIIPNHKLGASIPGTSTPMAAQMSAVAGPGSVTLSDASIAKIVAAMPDGGFNIENLNLPTTEPRRAAETLVSQGPVRAWAAS
ncbi:MAG: phage tail tape measure protein, partial [Microthrixaceae bacterium]|nr:phage tail tape measure protein [Microthrixaceae bacterium]